ncbi:MAG TPA: hypothetical protein PK400_08820, partial [Phycisphaerales bacterium]|nr:hypothetical protein [Phycisphaerales bacterium]
AGYCTAAEEYRTELQTTKRTMNETVDRLHARYESMVAELEQQGDDLHRENTRLRGHVEELQARLSADRIRGTSPELLVDCRIIDDGWQRSGVHRPRPEPSNRARNDLRGV